MGQTNATEYKVSGLLNTPNSVEKSLIAFIQFQTLILFVDAYLYALKLNPILFEWAPCLFSSLFVTGHQIEIHLETSGLNQI